MGPTSLLAATRGGGGRACGPLVWPQASSLAQYFSNIPEKIILDFHDHRRTFIFEVFFSGTLKQKTEKTKLILSFFF